jgi:glucokinase
MSAAGDGGWALAVDIGGTKVAAAVVTPDYAIASRAARPTPSGSATAADVLSAVLDTVADAAEGFGDNLVACGVGCPGRMDGRRVYPLNIPAWRSGFTLQAHIEHALGLPTAVDNDANLFALGEGAAGAAAGREHFLGVVLSTGIGGAVVTDGRLVRGATGSAGELGHVCVVPGGRTCVCGARGCLEAETSGLAIEAITGRPPTQADPVTVVWAGQLVGRAIAMAATLFDLDFAVVGGSVALGFGSPFFTAAEASARAGQPGGAEPVSIVPAHLSADAGLVGAASLALKAVD